MYFHRITGFSDFFHRPVIFFKGPNWVGVVSPLHLRTETNPVSEASYFYSQKHQTMEKVHKSINSACPSKEPYKIYYVLSVASRA
jgi:hypothetical protein